MKVSSSTVSTRQNCDANEGSASFTPSPVAFAAASCACSADSCAFLAAAFASSTATSTLWAAACTWCTAHGTLGADGSVEMHYDNGDSNTGTLSKDCKSLSWGWEAGTGTGAPVEPDAAAAPCKPGHHSGGRPTRPRQPHGLIMCN